MTMTREEQLRLAALINADRHEKLHALGLVIKGRGGLGLTPRTKGASSSAGKPKYDYLERHLKLKELSKMIKGLN
jgi:hypothetical protein